MPLYHSLFYQHCTYSAIILIRLCIKEVLWNTAWLMITKQITKHTIEEFTGKEEWNIAQWYCSCNSKQERETFSWWQSHAYTLQFTSAVSTMDDSNCWSYFICSTEKKTMKSRKVRKLFKVTVAEWLTVSSCASLSLCVCDFFSVLFENDVSKENSERSWWWRKDSVSWCNKCGQVIVGLPIGEGLFPKAFWWSWCNFRRAQNYYWWAYSQAGAVGHCWTRTFQILYTESIVL